MIDIGNFNKKLTLMCFTVFHFFRTVLKYILEMLNNGLKINLKNKIYSIYQNRKVKA